jgi:ankyrin repeat protein
VNGSNCVGVTALHMAAAAMQVDTVEKLLEWGAELEARNLDGWTALHYAAQAPKFSKVTVLAIMTLFGMFAENLP